MSVMVLTCTCEKGDSGALVIDESTGFLHGMVVATDPELNATYAVTAQDLFRDMNKVVGKSVTLPAPPQVPQPPGQPGSTRSQTRPMERPYTPFQNIEYYLRSDEYLDIMKRADSKRRKDPLAGEHMEKRIHNRDNWLHEREYALREAEMAAGMGKGEKVKGKTTSPNKPP